MLALAAILASGGALANARAARRRLARAHADLRRLDRGLLALGRAVAHHATGVEFFAQFGEDVILWEILGRPRAGFFVEAGAYDGVTFSVTHAFEAMGFGGILVEPNPAQVERCRSSRPGSRVVHAALTREPGEVGLLVVDHGGDQWLSRLESSPVTTPGRLRVTGRRVRVPAATLDGVLAGAPDPFDVLVLDVEGAELEALAGWSRGSPRARLALIEDTHRAAEIGEAMRAKGYSAAGPLGCSTLYVLEAEGVLLSRASAILGGRRAS